MKQNNDIIVQDYLVEVGKRDTGVAYNPDKIATLEKQLKSVGLMEDVKDYLKRYKLSGEALRQGKSKEEVVNTMRGYNK